MVRNHNTRGEALASRRRRGMQRAERAPQAGARDLPVLRGITPKCIYTRPAENVLVEARQMIVESQRVYRYGNAVMLEVGPPIDRQLIPLASSSRVEKNAGALLANIFLCEVPSKGDEAVPSQFAPPPALVAHLLASEPTLAALPEIKTYARRPIFDEEFTLRQSGWHADIGALIHAADVAAA